MKNTETYAKAVDRIRDEMAKEANHPGIQFLGGWLTGELVKRPELAEKLLDWHPSTTLENGLIKTIEYFDNLLKTDYDFCCGSNM